MRTRTNKRWWAAALVGGAVIGVTVSARAVGVAQLKVGVFALQHGVFNAIFAKEMCSCQFVDGLATGDCLARDNLPSFADKLVDITTDANAHSVSSTFKGYDEVQQVLEEANESEDVRAVLNVLGVGELTLGGPAAARYDENHPEFGCVLTHLPSDPATP